MRPCERRRIIISKSSFRFQQLWARFAPETFFRCAKRRLFFLFILLIIVVQRRCPRHHQVKEMTLSFYPVMPIRRAKITPTVFLDQRPCLCFWYRSRLLSYCWWSARYSEYWILVLPAKRYCTVESPCTRPATVDSHLTLWGDDRHLLAEGVRWSPDLRRSGGDISPSYRPATDG